MKLTIVGAGGIRMPLFARSLLRRVARGANVERLALTDLREERLHIMGRLVQHLAEKSGQPLEVEIEPNLDRALSGADAVVTTIRPGFEQGRITDELICKKAGILGQETVGAGGFAMAARAIPELLHICRRTRAMSHQALILNFTNPAGMVTQALHDQGFSEVIGICDSADNVKDYVALHLNVDKSRILTRVFGLNHLSGTMQVWIDGQDVTARLMADDDFLDKWFGIFGRDLVRGLGAFPNEYLYYYLQPESAVPAVLAEKETRGQKVLRLTERFFAAARDPELAEQPARLLEIHAACLAERSDSYMEYAWKNTPEKQRPDHNPEAGEGYAGVALDVIEALANHPTELALSMPNGGAVPWLAHGDVVEVTCRVDQKGVWPLPPPQMPTRLIQLVQQIKIFETLTVLSIRHRNQRAAKWALAAHPLVGFSSIAEKVFDEFAQAHAALRDLQ